MKYKQKFVFRLIYKRGLRYYSVHSWTVKCVFLFSRVLSRPVRIAPASIAPPQSLRISMLLYSTSRFVPCPCLRFPPTFMTLRSRRKMQPPSRPPRTAPLQLPKSPPSHRASTSRPPSTRVGTSRRYIHPRDRHRRTEPSQPRDRAPLNTAVRASEQRRRILHAKRRNRVSTSYHITIRSSHQHQRICPNGQVAKECEAG